MPNICAALKNKTSLKWAPGTKPGLGPRILHPAWARSNPADVGHRMLFDGRMLISPRKKNPGLVVGLS